VGGGEEESHGKGKGKGKAKGHAKKAQFNGTACRRGAGEWVIKN
jgi:hypothetical protein